MDSITHTIIAVASIAGTWYLSSWWSVRKHLLEQEREIHALKILMQAWEKSQQNLELSTEPEQLELFDVETLSN